MTTKILTLSGNYFDFLNPEEFIFDIEDIAQGLAHINRFTGQTKIPYNVANHSVLVSYEVSEENALTALLHDVSESVLGDVSSPLKQLLPEYIVLEKRVEKVIAEQFGTCFPMPTEVKTADLRMLVTEIRDLLTHPHENLRDIQPYDAKIIPWSAEVSKKMFLERYYELLSKRKVH